MFFQVARALGLDDGKALGLGKGGESVKLDGRGVAALGAVATARCLVIARPHRAMTYLDTPVRSSLARFSCLEQLAYA